MKLRPFRRQTPRDRKPESRPTLEAPTPRPIHAEAHPRMYSLQLPSFTDRR